MLGVDIDKQNKKVNMFFIYTRFICKKEWQTDREDLKDNIALSYVYNVDCPDFSEFGSIGFAQRFGGLVRTA